MSKAFNVVFIKGRTILLAIACLLVCLGIIIFFTGYISKGGSANRQKDPDYVILAANDSGMHCYQRDYSGFLILPPGNNLKVQVFKNMGGEAKLINSGINISYSIIDNTTSADKINFWEYAAYYGYDVKPDIGITGNGLSGVMGLSEDGKYYVATAIPITPYNDGSTERNPYQLASITVTDSETGAVLAQINDLVVPVSDEMDCGICHGAADTDLNILKAHDELSGTKLVSDLSEGIRHKCSDCHSDNILSEEGKPGVLPLSQAMHGFHADKMSQSSADPVCYSCHPGPVTECYRGVMYGEGISREGDLLDLAVEQKVVEKSGAWFAYAGERLGQGRENAKSFLRDNPATLKTIEDRVRKELGLLREVEVAVV
jgi:hypothetical protein